MVEGVSGRPEGVALGGSGALSGAEAAVVGSTALPSAEAGSLAVAGALRWGEVISFAAVAASEAMRGVSRSRSDDGVGTVAHQSAVLCVSIGMQSKAVLVRTPMVPPIALAAASSAEAVSTAVCVEAALAITAVCAAVASDQAMRCSGTPTAAGGTAAHKSVDSCISGGK